MCVTVATIRRYDGCIIFRSPAMMRNQNGFISWFWSLTMHRQEVSMWFWLMITPLQCANGAVGVWIDTTDGNAPAGANWPPVMNGTAFPVPLRISKFWSPEAQAISLYKNIVIEIIFPFVRANLLRNAMGYPRQIARPVQFLQLTFYLFRRPKWKDPFVFCLNVKLTRAVHDNLDKSPH